jgi:LmbE family N-acetylglucosaminyl deacetylase
VLGPRNNDYHPDHRYTAALLRDAAYSLIVPNIVPDAEPMDANPVFGYVADHFQKPAPFEPDVVLDVTDVEDRKIDALHCHESQMYEWLPYNVNKLDQVPDGDEARRKWLAQTRLPQFAEVADRFRDELIERYGEERGSEIQYAEAFENCEYGGRLTEENRNVLFPVE